MLGKTNALLPILLLLGYSAAQAAPSLLEQASSLLAQERPAEALALLEGAMDTQAGDPDYDYLLGQAALASHKPNLAVFALERTVMSKPGDALPRLTLARAYLELEEYDQALAEVSYLKQRSQDAKIAQVSNQYLQAIEQGKRRKSRHFDAQIVLGLGHDSNANSATNIDQFSSVTLSDNSKATASNAGTINLAGNASLPLGRKLRSESGIQLFQADYSDASFVNTRSAAFNTGINYKSGKHSHELLQLQATHTEVDEQLNNRQTSVQFSHQHNLKKDLLNLSAKAMQIRYADKYSTRDVQQTSASVQFHHRNSNQVLSSFSLMVGKDSPLESGSVYGRQFNAAQAGIVWSMGKAYTAASISYMQSRYDSPFFSTDRNDNNIGASLKLNYKINSKWMVGPSIKFARNQSSVDLYDYNRNQAMLFISHQII